MESLNEYEQQILEADRRLVPSEPPSPWSSVQAYWAAGVLAGGWTSDNHFVVISNAGYSIYDPINDQQLELKLDDQLTFAHLSPRHLKFSIPTTQETIDIFGVWGGDGRHIGNDRWSLSIIYPWYPSPTAVIVYGNQPYLPDYSRTALRLHATMDSSMLKGGFSPSGLSFALLGFSGVDFINRLPSDV